MVINKTFNNMIIKVKNKKGWIRIVEAFVAILLVTGVLLIIINKQYIGKKDISAKVYEAELSILREIQSDSALRDSILQAGTPPIKWGDENFPSDVESKITDRVPSYLNCEAQICEMDKICILDEYPDKDIYAQSVAITVTLTLDFDPRQLKLFCWVK